ncbi:MAG: zf-TFIIB domain-containing protein [Vicinamibacteria bacterium]|nr:zf-TFIIB domain-containing protein [Vicinamibacteria bacterium]
MRGTSLETLDREGVRYSVWIDECPACQGIWFDEGELSHFDNVTELVILEIRRIPRHDAQSKALKCPQCPDGPVMEKVESHEDRRVVMDLCPVCKGVWLDGGELQAIQQDGALSALIKLRRWLQQGEPE